MNEYILSLNDREIQEFLKEIENEHFILLLITLNDAAKEKMFGQLSDKAVVRVRSDLVRFTDHFKKISPTV